MTRLITLLALCASTQAANLFVASYSGNLTTLSLSKSPAAAGTTTSNHPNTPYAPVTYSYNLTTLNTVSTGAKSPSWLTYNTQHNVLYVLDEAASGGDGSIVSYRTSPSGKHIELNRLSTPGGAVHGTFFASGRGLAIAHYGNSSLTTYTVHPYGKLELSQTFNYELATPGPNKDSQTAPRPHQTIVDPTGTYLLVPDLGADLVRVYSINATTQQLTPRAPLKAKAGSGPRHGAFSHNTVSGSYVFYLGAELEGTLTAYRVTYKPNNGGLDFAPVPNALYNTLGPKPPLGKTSGLTAEVAFSPDGNFLIASNRNDTSFAAGHKLNPGKEASDSLALYHTTAKPYNGAMTFMGLFPAGGSFSRSVSINMAGNLVAVGLQKSGRVVVLERDTVSGAFEREVARVEVKGEVMAVLWDE